MSPAKRAFDLVLAVLALALLWPFMLGLALWILARDGAPVIYAGERMRSLDRPFRLWKFRTMRPDTEGAAASGVTGADKSGRITPTGRWLRRWRLDEMPQLFNILAGDLSFVGPRPPLRRYVEARPDLYDRVLASRPGLTGLATLLYHRREAALLAGCGSPEATHALYLRVCVPAKARLDLFYQRRWSLSLDLWILARTLAALAGLPPRRIRHRPPRRAPGVGPLRAGGISRM